MDEIPKSGPVGSSPDTEGLIEEGLTELCGALAKTDDPRFLRDFLNCLLTPAERRTISKRWLLVREIKGGNSQRSVAQKLGLSLCKITRGSRELKIPDSAFRRMMEL